MLSLMSGCASAISDIVLTKRSNQAYLKSCLLKWQEAVFALYLAQGKIEPQVVENMRTWRHTGFSIDQSVYLPAGDQAGIERLVQYITRCPFSLSRLVKVTDTGHVVYKAEKQSCRAFPDHNGDGIASGAKRNFQVLPPLDFIAEFLSCFMPLTRQDLLQGSRGFHPTYPTQGFAPNSLLRFLFEQVPGYTQKG